MAKIDWRRARPRRESESKYGEGVVLRNGARTRRIQRDELRLRAEAALRDWVAGLSPSQRRKLSEVP